MTDGIHGDGNHHTGVCGGAGEEERPLLMFNPSYTNYDAVGLRIGRKTVTVERELNEKW